MNKLKTRPLFFGPMLLVLTCTLLIVSPVSANWYAGNYETGSYGTSASISTPSSAPYLYPQSGSSEANWVSTAGTSSNYTYDYWAQTGWHYDYGMNAAISYVEYKDTYGYTRDDLDTQSWGSSNVYMVKYISGGWGIYINGSLEAWVSSSLGLPTAPWETLALSEIQLSSSNVLYTWFNPVYYLDSSYNLNNYNQNNFSADSPYSVWTGYDYDYNTYGP